ncbi:uncharacterized protein VTP21DRAFT_6657 [Calcarisporiella thermophila]|uniref:uncharacterized protein n=1 Tax=Calcarisporiella thermophila TaxID=911321 RepID=UPI0037440729
MMAATTSLSYPIPAWVALASCFLLTCCFVGGFYLFKDYRTGGKQQLSKDNPRVILQRFKSIALVCALCPLYVCWILRLYNKFSVGEKALHSQLVLTLQLMGCIPMKWNPFTIFLACLLPLLLTFILFLGPLSILYFEEYLPFQRHFVFYRDVVETISSLIGVRNYIVGPLSEEFVFRATMVLLLYNAGFSRLSIVFGLPCFFGLAHIHHAWEYYNNNGKNRRAMIQACLRAGFQFFYTTVFGWYSTLLFLRTGSILAPTICHIFCNCMGFPDFAAIGYYPTRIRIIMIAAFLTGISCFIFLLMPMTNPSLFGGSIYWI